MRVGTLPTCYSYAGKKARSDTLTPRLAPKYLRRRVDEIFQAPTFTRSEMNRYRLHSGLEREAYTITARSIP